MVTFGLFSLKKGRCSKQNLNVALLKILPYILGCFQQKMTEMVTFQQFRTKKVVGIPSGKKCCTSEN